MINETEQIDAETEARDSPAAAPAPMLDLLVARARAGDVNAWARLYQDNFESVFRHVRHLTGNTAVAEDLAQETFAQAFVSLSRFEQRASLAAWLHGIAIQLVRKHWRYERNTFRAHRRLALVPRVSVGGNARDPHDVTQQRARTQVLYAILSGMPDTLREIFVLRDLEQRSQSDIAQRLGISEGNAAVRATRARAHVRTELERLGWLTAEARR